MLTLGAAQMQMTWMCVVMLDTTVTVAMKSADTRICACVQSHGSFEGRSSRYEAVPELRKAKLSKKSHHFLINTPKKEVMMLMEK